MACVAGCASVRFSVNEQFAGQGEQVDNTHKEKQGRLQAGALTGIVILLVALTGLLGWQWWAGTTDAGLRDAGIHMLPDSRELPDVPLLSTTNHDLFSSAYAGYWQLIFFGYTYCPDICPTTLAELRRVYGALPEDVRDRLQVWMVSVDPQRDTPAQLRSYLDFFDSSFQGLTGKLADIQKLSQALGIPFIPGDSSKPGYTVDHGANLALIGPDGRQWGFIRAPLQVDALIGQLPLLLE